MPVYPVIMCGGSGTRLWPASRPSRPKQFIPLVGERSLFQETVERLHGIDDFAGLVIIAGEKHRKWILQQLPEDLEATLILEPEGRDSAPAIAAAAVWGAAQHDDAVMAVVASDHYIPDTENFVSAINVASRGALGEGIHTGQIVTLGVVPSIPTSAYGYIRPTKSSQNPGIPVSVEAFVEKPDPPTAEKYVKEGYLWNSGNFVFPAQLMLTELQKFEPEIISFVEPAVHNGVQRGKTLKLTDQFRKAKKISIDYAVMENTDRAAVLPIDLQWSDLGAWDAVYAVSQSSSAPNAGSGSIIAKDTSGCLLQAADGMTVAGIGLKNMAVIAEPDAVLICPLDCSQEVKSVVEVLKSSGAPQIDLPAKGIPSSIDQWAECYQAWLFQAALPLWVSQGVDWQGWGFHESLTLNHAGATGANRRARVQVRQIFSFATAAAMGWHGPWQLIADHGLAGFEKYYQRDDGLYRTLVSASGEIVDDRALLYDQAFVILAFASLINHHPDAEDRALALLDIIEAQLRHPAGGFRENDDRAFQSNPHMHLFEAAMHWMAVGKSPRWKALAQEIVDLALSRFIDADHGFVREFFDEKWAAAPSDDGHILEPGHQFEWAWLLERWATGEKQTKAYNAAMRLYEQGVIGIDERRNAAIDQMTDQFNPLTLRARLWVQTERLKAALRLGENDNSGIIDQDQCDSAESLWRYFDTPISGLWWDKLQSDAQFTDEPATASSFYHIIVAIDELRRHEAQKVS